MIGPQLPTHLKRKREQKQNDDDDDDDEEQQPAPKRFKLNDQMNKLIHPRNIYRYNKPNFHQLSLKYDVFKEAVKQNSKTGDYYINYNDSKSNVLLTKVLLKDDFGLEFQHPINHLCPPITQRLNYILWIQDLLQCITINSNKKKYHGFDIGIGASAIFPLLGIKIGEKQNELWSFIASDINSESIKYAKHNVEINNLNDKIKIIHQTNNKQIFKGIFDENNNKEILIDFTVCNPPFFEHLQETGLNKKRSNNATKSFKLFRNRIIWR